MPWRVRATADVEGTSATLYLSPHDRLWLRVVGNGCLLHESFHDTLEEAVLEAATRPELSQPLYEGLLDVLDRQPPPAQPEPEPEWKPRWPEDY